MGLSQLILSNRNAKLWTDFVVSKLDNCFLYSGRIWRNSAKRETQSRFAIRLFCWLSNVSFVTRFFSYSPDSVNVPWERDCSWLFFFAKISYFNFQNNFYRLNKKAVDRLDGRMLLRLQDLRKEVNYVFFLGMFLVKKPFIDLIVVVNITEFAAVWLFRTESYNRAK